MVTQLTNVYPVKLTIKNPGTKQVIHRESSKNLKKENLK